MPVEVLEPISGVKTTGSPPRRFVAKEDSALVRGHSAHSVVRNFFLPGHGRCGCDDVAEANVNLNGNFCAFEIRNQGHSDAFVVGILRYASRFDGLGIEAQAVLVDFQNAEFPRNMGEALRGVVTASEHHHTVATSRFDLRRQVQFTVQFEVPALQLPAPNDRAVCDEAAAVSALSGKIGTLRLCARGAS